MKDEASLADQFVADTFTFAKRLNLKGRDVREVEPILERYRHNMKLAHRFVLDDEFTTLATMVSSQMTPKKMLARVQYATLPYGVTWIEFNLRMKVRLMRELHFMDNRFFDFTSVSERLGVLLYRLNEHDTLCELIAGDPHVGVVPAMMCYFFSTREQDFTSADGKPYGCIPYSGAEGVANLRKAATEKSIDPREQARFEALTPIIGKGTLWGFSKNHPTRNNGIMDNLADLAELSVPEFLMRHGDSGYSGMYAPMYKIIERIGGENKLATLISQQTVEFAGMIRWVVCVLAMLNEVPVRTHAVTPTGTIRTGLTNRRRLMDYHRVSIRLPKTDPLKFVERPFRAGHKKRAHEVRSHWRTYLHDVYCKPDDHEWEYDNDVGYRLCGKCMASSTLIKEHVRGDASLGWVRKEYVLTTDHSTVQQQENDHVEE